MERQTIFNPLFVATPIYTVRNALSVTMEENTKYDPLSVAMEINAMNNLLCVAMEKQTIFNLLSVAIDNHTMHDSLSAVMKRHTPEVVAVDFTCPGEEKRQTKEDLLVEDLSLKTSSRSKNGCSLALHGGANFKAIPTFVLAGSSIFTAIATCLTGALKRSHCKRSYKRRKNVFLALGYPKVLHLFWLTMIMLPSSVFGRATTCTAGDFIEGDKATVTCYFPDDIVNHDNVHIQYFPVNTPTNSSAKDVLVCTAEEVTSSRCQGHDHFVLKGHTRNTISIEIVSVTTKEAGRYICQFLPHDGSPRDMCNLTVQDTGRLTPVAKSTPHTTTTTVNEKQSSSIHPQSDVNAGETEAVSVGVIVGAVLGGVLPAIVVFLFICCCVKVHKSKRHGVKQQMKEQQQNDTTLLPPRPCDQASTAMCKPSRSISQQGLLEEKPQSYTLTDVMPMRPVDVLAASGGTVTAGHDDEFGVESALDLTDVKNAGTTEHDYVWARKVESSGSITELEQNKITEPTSSATDSGKTGPGSLLRHLGGLLTSLQERPKNPRGETPLSASYAVPSCEARISKEALQDLLGKLQDSQAQVQEILNNVERDPLPS